MMESNYLVPLVNVSSLRPDMFKDLRPSSLDRQVQNPYANVGVGPRDYHEANQNHWMGRDAFSTNKP
ncbi:MAG: hypothetical protein QGH96_06755 [Desulfobacterales bacterium]|jgi:hypothetical protein|nr:hypothetical protein [Desulfobacterales bacterium]